MNILPDTKYAALLQSEEAKRLRKRKKADLLRLEDMQRRQKQRVEEVRETQKKVGF